MNVHFSCVQKKKISRDALFVESFCIPQEELYRSCYLLGHTYLNSEWAGKKLGGRIGFHIKKVGWSIERLRDGDRLDEHIARFRIGGRSYKRIKTGDKAGDEDEVIREYILLDSRKSIPDKPNGMMKL